MKSKVIIHQAEGGIGLKFHQFQDVPLKIEHLMNFSTTFMNPLMGAYH